MSANERHAPSASAALPRAVSPDAVPPATLTPDSLLTRAQVAVALAAAGFPVARATLATKAVRGGGPMFRHFGRWPLYRWGDALSWAQDRLSPPRRSTSDTSQDATL